MNELATQPMESEQLAQLSNMPRDLALVKIENDNMMTMAAGKKRDWKDILCEIQKHLRDYKSFCTTAWYCKPVGRDKNNNNIMKYARGPSIRMAEAMAAAAGFNRVRTDVTPIDQDTVRVEATYVDYCSGRVWQDSGVVSKLYKSRDGGTRRHDDDRFYNVVVKAEASKRIRECINRCIPPAVRSELELTVNEELDAYLDDETVKKLIASFASKNVTKEQVEALVGKRLENFNRDDRKTLIGVWNSIEQGETNPEELFAQEQPKPDEKPKGSKTKQLAQKLKEETEGENNGK